MPFGLWAWTGPRNHELDGGPDSPWRRGNFWGKGCPLLSMGTFCRELCRSGWTDRFAILLWTWVGRMKHKFNRIRQVAPMCETGGHIGANTIEPTICSSDAVLRQVTLTTCYYYYINLVYALQIFETLFLVNCLTVVLTILPQWQSWIMLMSE